MPFASRSPILCQPCRGKGTRFTIVPNPVFGDRLVERTTCSACSGTGIAKDSDSSSAQPHRFTSVDVGPHPLAD